MLCGQKVVHNFRIVNNTNTTVRISGAVPSCGRCATVTVHRNLLAPGEEGFVRAEWDSRTFSGLKGFTIDVIFDSPNREVVRLRLHANSRSDLVFYPDNLNFGKIARGTTPTKEMTITFAGNPQVKITDVKCSSSYIQLAVQELRRNNNDVIYQLSATVQADIPSGSWDTDIWLTTNDPSMPTLRVPLQVEVEPASGARPASMGQQAIRWHHLQGFRPGRQGRTAQLQFQDDQYLQRFFRDRQCTGHCRVSYCQELGGSYYSARRVLRSGDQHGFPAF